MNHPKVSLHILPGGIMPKRQTEGAIGYDVCIRAIVSPGERDPTNPHMRKALFDFINYPTEPEVRAHVAEIVENNKPELIFYRMAPNESVLVGIGFATAIDFPMFFWVAPRSGLASKWGITVTNAPGTVNPDYRGEAGVPVYNRNSTAFDLRCGMRIAQILFQEAIIPELVTCSYEELTGSLLPLIFNATRTSRSPPGRWIP